MTSPYSLLAELTYRCPLQCPYCSNPLQLRNYTQELDTETWKRVFREAADLGVVQVHLSGGEPLARTDLVELVQEARDCDLYSHLSTSAAIGDESTFGRLREAGLDAVQISLQDSQPGSNDWIAGFGCFDKKERAVREARRLGFAVTLNVVLHRHNLSRLEEIIDLAANWDADRVELAHTQYTGWAFQNRAALLPSREQVEQAEEIVAAARNRLGRRPDMVHVLPDYFQDLPKACLGGWGNVMLTVAPDGAVLPCQTAREIPDLEFPNCKDHSLEDIWFHSDVFTRFRGTDWLPEPCRSCERKELDFGGCRCQAFLVTGDVAATDPVCHLSPMRFLIDAALQEADAAAGEFEYRTMSGTSQ